ncbi:MAG: FAD-dependent oxidoreductase [Bacteroidales bacterium]|nr:FAD-dependent oxidoreductase [Bacteroidales bacterium]MCL2133675.1 FAD-dependent oxidoreductase [Bacteroidales bacterium]
MSKIIKSIAQLEGIKKDFLKNQEKYKYQILVCGGTGCVSSNCGDVENAINEELKEQGIAKDAKVYQTGCMGICALGPVMLVLPDRTFYTELDPEKAKEIVKSHLVGNKPIEEYTFYDKTLLKHVPKIDDIEFFKSQVKIVLDLCGIIDYTDINDYIAHDGYFAAAKAITGMTQEEVVKEVEISGLRGRGGAGFPTGTKLRAGFSQKSDIKYMVCNADEGDPGAFMDRSVIEGDPHCLIEGMMLSAYAIGAQQGYVYIRAEYPIAIERLKVALDQAREYGLLGNNLFGTKYNFDLEIRIGAGAFVCGEETALLASIEGKRGEPQQKPPFPFQKGLFGYPTIINNVETLANISKIIRNGGKWYAAFGMEKAPGTKVFALAGDVVNTGIVEVPIGMPIGNIIYNIGGGIPNKKEFKAAQIGGPSGGCITKENLNVPADYESLSKMGAIMGSGGLIVMNEDTCMVDTARFFMDFIRDESCGKCVACRVGTKRMLEVLEDITQGKGRAGDIELLIELGEAIQESAMCGLGQTAPNPILSTIRFFREEFEEHIHKKHCRAGVCSAMFIAPCENTCPANVNVTGYISLISAGRFQDAYNLVMQENPFPAICGRICTRPCERKCRRGTVDEPLAIRDLKRFAADYAFKNELPYKMQLTFAKKGKRVAVIGAGASGLTCAYYLVNIGYDVDVFESESVAGGVLAFGIPEYRLPEAILQHEIDLIKQAGVNIHLNKEIGKNMDFRKLREDYDAIYVSTGTQYPAKVNIEGEDLQGVMHGITFLKDTNLRDDVKLHGTVAIIGGGNTAIDSARSALRIGAERVIVVYRRTQDAMPAYIEEVHEAIEEGIEIMELTAPVKFIGKNNKVVGIECVKMTLGEFDASGRRKSVEIKGSNFILDVDFVIPAVSQYADLPFIGKDEIGVTKWGTFIVDPETHMCTMKGVFAGGDVVRGPDTVISAIADGKKAASSIDLYLGGNGLLNKGAPIDIPKVYDEDEVITHAQFEMEVLPPEVRKQSFAEVVLGFHKINAIAESMRCLHCERR